MNTVSAIALLDQSNTGAELLAVLDSLVDDSAAEFVHLPVLDQTVPTLEEIAF